MPQAVFEPTITGSKRARLTLRTARILGPAKIILILTIYEAMYECYNM